MSEQRPASSGASSEEQIALHRADPPRGPVAAIDVGTNTVLLLVACADAQGEPLALADECRTARLGAGLARSGRLDPLAAERTLLALRELRDRALALGVQPADLRAVGTAALRRARDASAFLERVERELGLAIEVLGEEEEARLAHASVCPAGGPDAWVVDVGGGSTEVSGDGGRVRLSAPIGAVVLTEAYLGSGDAPPFESGGWGALLAAVERACERFPADAAGARAGTPALELVALGGTAVNAACLHRRLGRFDPAAAEGHRLPAPWLAEAAQRLAAMPCAERRRLPIEAERAEILPAGLACLAGAVRPLGAREVRVSARGLRYAVARELLAAPGPHPAHPKTRGPAT